MKYPNRVIKTGESDASVVKVIQKRLKELNIVGLTGTDVYGLKIRNARRMFSHLLTGACKVLHFAAFRRLHNALTAFEDA